MRQAIRLVTLLFLAALVAGPALAQETIDPYIELLRSNIRAEKAAIITKVMEFTEEESSVFWPVYREYELDLSKLYDARLELIRDYARNYGTLTDKKAKEIIKKAFGLEKKRTSLKQKYFRKFEKELPAKTVAKFFQLENLIQHLIDLQIAAELPLVK